MLTTTLSDLPIELIMFFSEMIHSNKFMNRNKTKDYLIDKKFDEESY